MDGADAVAHRLKRFRRLQIGAILVLIAFGVTDVRRRARIDPDRPESHRTDLTIFTGAGAAFLEDDAPYSYANARGWKYAYPPFFALCVAPLAALPTEWQAVVWYVLSCLMLWCAWREAVRISRRLGLGIRLTPANETSGRWIGWAAAAAAALPVLNCLQRGQVGIVYLWLLLWGLRLLLEADRWSEAIVGGVILALPGVVKVTPALPAVCAVGTWSLMQFRSGRHGFACSAPTGLTAGVALFLLLIPSFILGWQANWRHLTTWRESIASMAVEVDPASTLETPYTVRNQNLSNALYRCGNWIDYTFLGGPDDRVIDAVPFNPDHQLAMDAAWVRPSILALRLLLVGVLLATGLRAVLQNDEWSLAALFGLACVLSLIISPMSRGHYFVLLLPAVLWGGGRSDVRQWQLHALLWTPAALTLLHYALLDLTGRIGLLGLGMTVWYIVAAVALAMRGSVATETRLEQAPSQEMLSRAA